MSERPEMTANTTLVSRPVKDRNRVRSDACTSIEWYSNGQARTVEIDGVEIKVGFIGRKGRRARIRITAPTGAVFRPS